MNNHMIDQVCILNLKHLRTKLLPAAWGDQKGPWDW